MQESWLGNTNWISFEATRTRFLGQQSERRDQRLVWSSHSSLATRQQKYRVELEVTSEGVCCYLALGRKVSSVMYLPARHYPLPSTRLGAFYNSAHTSRSENITLTLLCRLQSQTLCSDDSMLHSGIRLHHSSIIKMSRFLSKIV